MQNRTLVLGATGCAIALALVALRCGGDDNKNDTTTTAGNVLVRVTNESDGANCANGGFAIASGADTNKDGILEDDEVVSTAYACNGAPPPVDTPCHLTAYGKCTNADLRGAYFGDGGVFIGIDFTGSDLRGATFFSKFDNAIFANAKLDGISAQGSSFALADFSNASLKEATFSDTSTTGANFTNADLSGASFSNNSGLVGVNATGAKFVGALLSTNLRKANFTGADFTNAQLSGSSVVGANFTNAKLVGADLRGVSFVDVTEGTTVLKNVLTGTNFSFASLFAANFTAVNFTGVGSFANAYYDSTTTGLSGPDLSTALNLSSGTSFTSKDFSRIWIDLGANPWSGFDLTGSTLSGGHFSSPNFTNVKLNGAHVVGTHLTSVNLTGTDCTGADFTDSFLEGLTASAATKLDNANFTRAALTSATWSTASANGANFTKATLFNTDLSTLVISTTAPTWSGAFTRTATLPGSPTGTIAVEDGADLTGADLSGIKMTYLGINFATPINFTGANFTNAILQSVAMDNQNLANANLTNASASISFAGANLAGANLTGADLSFSQLTSANMVNANLTNANLLCAFAGISATDLGLPVLTGVTWSNTECPDGTLTAAGAVADCTRHLLGGEVGD